MSDIGANILTNARYESCLPPDFLYGAASASHQIEGHIDADGKGPNVWDVVLSERDGENGKDACNSYVDWEKDVELLKSYGMNCYRFSISWARIIPLGGRDDPINEEGILYYSKLIDHLVAQGIEPVVTIFHWDHPQALEDRYGGFANAEEMVPDFARYASVCFERFGDRVTKWITMNEPHIFTMLASMTFMSKQFDVERDYTRLAKSLLLCHAHAVQNYRTTFQPSQKGVIGISLDCDWTEPIDDSVAAEEMQQVFLDVVLGLYAEPIYLGHYTDSLRAEYGDSLPTFSPEEAEMLKGSSDFFGLNHYGTSYSTGRRLTKEEAGAAGPVWSFARTEKVHEKDGVQIGVRGQNGHPYDVPWGFRKLLNYISKRYTAALDIPIWITENGMGVENESSFSLEDKINDRVRQTYYAGYVEAMLQAVLEDGVNVGGYMAWSLMDNLEWLQGYDPRFGITIVDRSDGFKRTAKDSAHMLRKVFAFVAGSKQKN